ncbi:MAG: cupin domain-containing protein [Aliidongia sp.]
MGWNPGGRRQIEFDGIPLGRRSYVRHPSGPTPSVIATVETVLFVKRGHIPADDQVQTMTAPHLELWQVRQEDGLLILPLHRHGGLTVSLMRYRPGAAAIVDRPPGGTETLVLEGTMLDERSAYPSGSWIRNPPGSLHQPYSVEGCLLYCQTGHLPIL